MSATLFIFIAFQTVLIASSNDKCATLYNLHSYQGQPLSLQDRSTYNSLRHMNYVPNSLTVAPDCFLTAYDSYGKKHTFTEDQPSLSWNQAQTLDASCCECKGCSGASDNLPICARLYENERCDGCSGFRLDFRSGDSAKDLGLLNNRMSSVAVRRGCTLTVFYETHYRGWRQNFTESNNKLGGNWFKKISSAVCGCNDAGPVVNPIYSTTHAPVTLPTVPTWPPIYTVPTTPYPWPSYTLPTVPTRPSVTLPTVPTWPPIYTLPTVPTTTKPTMTLPTVPTRPPMTLPTVPTTTRPPMTLPTVPTTMRPPMTLPTVPTTTRPPMTLPTVPTTSYEDSWENSKETTSTYTKWSDEEYMEVTPIQASTTPSTTTTTTPKPVTTTPKEPEDDWGFGDSDETNDSKPDDDWFGEDSSEVVPESEPITVRTTTTTTTTTTKPKPVTTTTKEPEVENGWGFESSASDEENDNDDNWSDEDSSEVVSESAPTKTPTTTTEQPADIDDDWGDLW